MNRWLLVISILLLLHLNSSSNPNIILVDSFSKTYILIGDFYYSEANYELALKAYTIPLLLFYNDTKLISTDNHILIEATCNQNKLSIVLNHKVGKVYYHLGEYNNSIHKLKMLLGEDQLPSLTDILGSTHYYLGMCYNKVYDYEKSLLHYLLSLDYYTKTAQEGSGMIGLIYCDLGNVYYNIQNYKKAFEYYELSKKILSNQIEPDNSKLSIIENNIGSIYFRNGENNAAISHYKLAIKLIQNEENNYYDHSMYLNNLAGVYLSLKNIDSAELFYQKSLLIRQKFLQNNVLLVQTHNQIGLLYLIDQEYEKSLENLQQAITLNSINFNDSSWSVTPHISDIKDYMSFGVSQYYRAIALNGLYQENREINSQYLNESYKVFDSMMSFFEHVFKYEINTSNIYTYMSFYELVVNTILDTYNKNNFKDSNRWFSIFQRGKSILLYQHFIESRAKEFANIPLNLIQCEMEFRKDMLRLDKMVKTALDNGEDRTNLNGFISLIIERNKKIHALDSLIRVFENEYPEYYQIKYNFKPTPLNNIQQLLINHEAIIEYHITDSIIYSLCITGDQIIIHNEKTDSILGVARDHIIGIKFYNNDQLYITGRYLYEKLISPFDSVLQYCKKLTIIPDTELSLFPFETLIIKTDSKTNKSQYLIERYEISYHFSASLWHGYSGQCSSNLDKQSFLALAPVNFNYNMADKRQLNSLSFTKAEVLSIEKLFKSYGLNTLCLLDTNASKSVFIDNSANFSIIHLATHNTYVYNKPNLSGIVFADYQFSDGYEYSNILNIDETYNLNLNADLVVLSACMTGVGEIMDGEGLISLSRGFFYSGANNIIFTLWNAPDKNTYKFMTTFYEYIFQGLSFSSSLQKTKLCFINNDKTSLPIFWSNYLILGN